MATPYSRAFTNGRSSEMLFNDELHQIYESVKHLAEDPGVNAQPEAKMDQAIWHDKRKNKLMWWDKTEQKWREYYENEHRITGEIMSVLPPANPVYGQLWMHNGVLCYFDGSQWNPVKALIQDGSQFSLDVFKNFLLISPLWQSGNTCISIDDSILKYTTMSSIAKINPSGYIDLNIRNLDEKSLIVLEYNSDTNSDTYNTYIAPSKAVEISFDIEKTRIYNRSQKMIKVKTIYKEVHNDENNETNKTGRLTGINYELLTSEAVDEFQKQERMYLQGVLDTQTDSTITGDGTKWRVGHNCIMHDPEMPIFKADAMSQLLVPYIDYDRIFLDRDLDTEKYQEVSKVCIQYKRNDITNHVPSLVHVNPGRLTKITKRIVKIDRTNPKIMIPAESTEYYGFKGDSPFGELIVPDSSNRKLCDYTIIDGGILLNYNACQNFDYILAIHYEFSWYKSTGTMSHVSSKGTASTYAIEGFKGAMNMFVEGYDIEDPYFKADAASETITFVEDVKGLEIAAVHSPKTEYGYIRHIDIKNNAIIKPLSVFKQNETLVFINGELVHPINDGMTWNQDGTISIPNGKQDMMWSTVSLRGLEEIADGKTEDYMPVIEAGTVDATGTIPYTAPFISKTRIPIVFIDGLLVTKEDIQLDEANHIITIANSTLVQGQDYVVIEDKFGWFYDSATITPALPVGNMKYSLVYMNGKLLCDAVALDALSNNSDDLKGAFNEIKCFKTLTLAQDGVTEIWNKDYRIYDSINMKWIPCEDKVIKEVENFAYSYENARKSIHMNIAYDVDDNIQIYAFNTTNSVEHPLEIHTIMADNDHPILTVGSGMYWDKNLQKEVPISNDPNWSVLHPNQPNWNKLAATYLYGKNTLRVYLNGIRQYPFTVNKCDGIKEALDGLTFKLPEPFIGQITYIVELPENNMSSPCSMEVLDHSDIKNGYVNFYKTKLPLFPGRVTLYINGIRQPKETYSVFDNNTLLINDPKALIGCVHNYPSEDIQVDPNKKVTVNWPESDKLLVEVRQDERIEKNLSIEPSTFSGELFVNKYDLDLSMLETCDEILVFVNGMFTGVKLHDGYAINVARQSVMITDPDVNNIIKSDSLCKYLIGHKDEHTSYLERNNNIDYKQKNADMILEWR